MKRTSNGLTDRLPGRKRGISALVLIANVLLLLCAVFLYGRYSAAYQERLREENLGNIANLNRSAASRATSLIESQSIKLEDAVCYLGQSGFTFDEALAYLEASNSSEIQQFELIGSDYTGARARRDETGSFRAVSYAHSTYIRQQRAFDDLEDDDYGEGNYCVVPEFTDGINALPCFAVYRHLTLTDGDSGEPRVYTLLLGTESTEVLRVINRQIDLNGQKTVLIDGTGKYMVSSEEFGSATFYKYLALANGLSLDRQQELREQVADTGAGELYLRDKTGQDCVFRYERVSDVQLGTNGWYCVTRVPLTSFHAPAFRVNYAVSAVLVLFILMMIDVVWLQSINRRLRVSMRREKEASEAKTDFLSRMSHDIRTPLNGIIGLTALALDEPNPPTTREYLESIRVSGQFLGGLVNDILDMSKVESGMVELHPEPYTVNDLVRYVDAVVSPLCREKGLEFRMPSPVDGTPVLLDRLRFNQVVFNLLSNAVKYTPKGGLVVLEWERADLPDNRAALQITVRDNGIGMSEEFQRRMFDSFTQEHAQSAYTGTGLGLTIVRSLVRLMGGDISVSSRQGEGSEFYVTLTAQVCEQTDAVREETSDVSFEGKRVLLCEDNRINTLVVSRLLEKWGIAVDCAVNGRVGVESFAASAPFTYDAVLMDVMMPEMNGLDATRAIRVLNRPDSSVPILAMTANAYDNDVNECLASGMNAHMGKPIDPARLRLLLARYLCPKVHP